MAKKKKWYVVWKGRKPGVYNNWVECEKQVKGYAGASFRSFPSEKEARDAFENNKSHSLGEQTHYMEDSISVDVGSHGNPGFVEYKGVYTKTGEVVFFHPGIEMGTNNMGEFLAIVHALAYLKKKSSSIPVYSDSATAMKWVRQKKANSSLKRTPETEQIWQLIEKAENWLHDNTWENPLLKWDTKAWGEIKADYGRKG
ncbi:ribonuclease H1 domain-containing protein [Alteribacillus iranensis]|uniref:Ribonuclease H n=1 Tax=Alteribacillus iranensis TaxID=930128 RepID=A0A1I2FAN0_9BACI|nr:ribonuclease H family protein [Alteribacillus iranensis]SFF02275.1 ribonuclease HI [Alteribacillus iranensis]